MVNSIDDLLSDVDDLYENSFFNFFSSTSSVCVDDLLSNYLLEEDVKTVLILRKEIYQKNPLAGFIIDFELFYSSFVLDGIKRKVHNNPYFCHPLEALVRASDDILSDRKILSRIDAFDLAGFLASIISHDTAEEHVDNTGAIDNIDDDKIALKTAFLYQWLEDHKTHSDKFISFLREKNFLDDNNSVDQLISARNDLRTSLQKLTRGADRKLFDSLGERHDSYPPYVLKLFDASDGSSRSLLWALTAKLYEVSHNTSEQFIDLVRLTRRPVNIDKANWFNMVNKYHSFREQFEKRELSKQLSSLINVNSRLSDDLPTQLFLWAASIYDDKFIKASKFWIDKNPFPDTTYSEIMGYVKNFADEIISKSPYSNIPVLSRIKRLFQNVLLSSLAFEEQTKGVYTREFPTLSELTLKAASGLVANSYDHAEKELDLLIVYGELDISDYHKITGLADYYFRRDHSRRITTDDETNKLPHELRRFDNYVKQGLRVCYDKSRTIEYFEVPGNKAIYCVVSMKLFELLLYNVVRTDDVFYIKGLRDFVSKN